MARVMGMGSAFGEGGGTRRCSFCHRREEAVAHLVRARGVAYICDACVALAQEAIAAAAPDTKLARIRPRPARIADRDAAEAAIEEAFETVFSADRPIRERCAAIEGGGNLEPTMEEVAVRYGPARQVDVAVDHVRLLSEDEAEVHFSLFLSEFGGSGMRQTGYAVRVADRWKVARETWCGLVRMAGVVCPPPAD